MPDKVGLSFDKAHLRISQTAIALKVVGAAASTPEIRFSIFQFGLAVARIMHGSVIR